MAKMRATQISRAGGPLELVERPIPEPAPRTVRIKVEPLQLIMGRRAIEGWYSGTSIDAEDTLNFSSQAGVASMNESYPLEKAAEAFDRMLSGKARFRVVLTM